MSSKKPKATRRRMISCFAQIVQEHIPGWKIEQIAAGEKVKARKFSYSSQVYLLMLSQFLHLFSLNEIVDVSRIYAPELSRLRGMSPASLNTFSNANRTRDSKVMQSFFWVVYDTFRRLDEGFIRGRHHGKLARFKLRGIYAVDSSTIQLAYWCIDWAKHRQRKAAVKIDGHWRTMVFLTNNFEWAASTIAELYKARWEVELLFKELKQTLQLQDFYGENENAVEWQIWAALLTHLVLRWLKYKSGAACSYSRFAALVRAIVWLRRTRWRYCAPMG